MPRQRASNLFQGVHAKLVFPTEGDRQSTLDVMRRFSVAKRGGYRGLLRGEPVDFLKSQNGPLRTRFRLNTRYAGDALMLAEAAIASARERGEDPCKVVFGGRKLFVQLSKGHLSGKALKKLKREWRERRQGHLYSRGEPGGNKNLRLVLRDGALWLRINLGDGAYAWAIVKTSHPNLGKLVERVLSQQSYNVGLFLRDGEVYAHVTWTEEAPPLTHTRANGVMGLDVNSDPYHLALALVSPDGNLKRYLTVSLEEVDRAENRGAKELVLWKVAHRVVAVAEEHGVAIATERLKYLRKTMRGDGSGRAFRRKEHRFAYTSLLRKVHSLARKRGVQVVEVNPQDTSTIGALKYAPLLSLSKDAAAAYVIGRRALGFQEKLPKGYQALIQDGTFRAHVQDFYASRVQELEARHKAERNPYLKRRLSRELRKARASLSLFSSLQGSPGSQKGSTHGRNSSGANPWRVLRAGTFLPLLGREVPRDLSPLKPILLRGLWEGWKVSLGPHPGGGPGCANVHFG